MEVDLNNKTVLITGGTGFVGSHLVEALLKENARVIATYQTEDPLSYFSIKKLGKSVILSKTDVNDFDAVYHLVTKFNVDFIFHLAAQPLVDVALNNPMQTLYTNILGTINILESARLFPHIQGVIVASSDKAYGKLSKKEYTEDDALKGDHPYEVSKSAADLIALSYYATYKTPVVTTRFGNIYGEGDPNYSRIIPGIIKSIVTTSTLDIRSDGKYVRDYLHVKDVARGYILLAKNIQKAQGQAFNFGSNETETVLNVIKKIELSLKKKVKYAIKNTAHNEIPYQSLNYSKINKMFGWKPKITIAMSAKNMYSYYKKIL